MSISIRSRFILISVSITILALLLFASVIHERATKYKHQQEISTNYILEEHLHREIISFKSSEEIKRLLAKKITQEDHAAKLHMLLDENIEPQFVTQKEEINKLVLDEIYAKVKNNKFKGQAAYKNKSYFWLIKELSLSQDHKAKLLTVYALSPSAFSEFLKFFGLPFVISGFILCWTMVWASIILSSFVVKLQQQKQTLSEQAVDIEKSRDTAMRANLAKSSFLANMSHEIRTPLTSIIGFAESFRDINQSMEERLDATNTIIKSGKHLMHIINEILDLSKVESGNLEVELTEFPIFSMLNDINQLVSKISEDKGINFEITYAYPLPKTIVSDQLRLKQILLNLCSNAIKFTEEGSVNLIVSHEKESSLLIFDIIDTGIGLSEEQINKIFKPFEQADSTTTRKFGGTGLGLTVSRKLIEMLGGELSVKSKVNKGSRFSAKLNAPISETNNYIYESDFNEALNKDNDNDEKNEIPLLNGKVLVVEDNIDIQELVILLLKRVGIKPDIVENGLLAVEAALKNKYDLIFMDMQMPVLDGLSAMKRLQQQGYQKPIIAMTANVMIEDREACEAAGFSDFIGKPIVRKELYTVLKTYIKPKQISERAKLVLTSNLLNDEPDLINLIDKFMLRLPEMQNQVNLAHENKNEEEFSGLVHQLKGVGGGYGYPMLTELCAKIEFQIAAKNTENIAILINEFNLMVTQILDGHEENHNIVAKAK